MMLYAMSERGMDMDRNEAFPAAQIAAVSARLAWASLQLTVEKIGELQVLVDGQDADVEALRVVCSGDRLLIEQPVHGVSLTMVTGHWMQIRVRVPEDWKGSVDLSTSSGPVTVQGISATTCRLATVNGPLTAHGVVCEELDLRTVNGLAKVEACEALRVHMNSVNSDWPVTLTAPFEQVDANTVTGSLVLTAPVTSVRCGYHTVTGRLHTLGVSLQDSGASVTMDSVSGDLSIGCAQ